MGKFGVLSSIFGNRSVEPSKMDAPGMADVTEQGGEEVMRRDNFELEPELCMSPSGEEERNTSSDDVCLVEEKQEEDVQRGAAAHPFSTDAIISSSFERSMDRVSSWIDGIEPVDLECVDEENQTSLEGSTAMSKALRTVSGTNLNQAVIDGLGAADKRAYSINLSSNGLKAIPSLGAFHSLKCLSLANNSISTIPSGLLPRSLHSLDLSRNALSTVEGLKDLSRLRVLKLRHNRITRIGHGLASCSSLRELDLAENKVSEVEGLHRLLKLSVLDLAHNRLTTTKSLSQLAANYGAMQVFNVVGNPVVVNLGSEAFVKYVRGLLPNLLYLNEQRVKSVIREASTEVPRSTTIGGSHGSNKLKSSSRPSARVSKSCSKSKSSVPGVQFVRGTTSTKHQID